MPPAALSPVQPLYALDTIRDLDPLGADDLCRRLPAVNAQGDVNALAGCLRAIAPDPRAVQHYTVPESLAAMRDLGILLGSLKRHGTEPLVAVPELTATLVALGHRTGMVPRDTVHHYTAWNPAGPRHRMYTGDPQEACLQEAVRTVFPRLCESLVHCQEIGRLHPADDAFAPAVRRLGHMVESMVEAIDVVGAGVSPTFFARVLRPYFEDVTVAGRAYLGPGAAQVPLWLVDVTLWASDRSDACYADFQQESVPYALPAWREFYASRAGTLSAVSKLERAIEEHGTDRLPPSVEASAQAVAAVLRTVKTFRGRHFRIARQAYDEKVRLYDSGSRGGPIALLRRVLALTRENEALVARRSSRSVVAQADMTG